MDKIVEEKKINVTLKIHSGNTMTFITHPLLFQLLKQSPGFN